MQFHDLPQQPKRKSEPEHRLRLLIWILIFGLLLLLAQLLPTWVTSHAAPQRQTVPLTPPATWTPVQPPTTLPAPTRPKPPVEETPAPPDAPSATPGVETPTPLLTPTVVTATATGVTATSEATPIPGVATATLAAPTATRRGPARPGASLARQADPWLGLGTDVVLVGPGSTLTIRLDIQNLGDLPLQGAVLTLKAPAELIFGATPRVSVGTTRLADGQVQWEPGRLPGGKREVLELDATVAQDVLPDRQIVLQASLRWPGGRRLSNEAVLSLPWAPLPAAGKP